MAILLGILWACAFGSVPGKGGKRLAAPACARGIGSIAAERLHEPIEVRPMATVVPGERGNEKTRRGVEDDERRKEKSKERNDEESTYRSHNSPFSPP